MTKKAALYTRGRVHESNHQPILRLDKRLLEGAILGLTLLLIGMPLHALVVTVGGYWTGQPLLIALWKEVIVIMIVGLAVVQSWRTSWQWVWRPANVALGIAIGLGVLGLWLTRRLDVAALVGIKTTVFPWLLFLAIQPFAQSIQWVRLRTYVLMPSLVVASLAVWQFLFIPTGLLTSLGYSASTIQPFQGIAPGADFGRSFATLGGPNQLGVYLILPLLWFLALSLKASNRERRIQAALGFGLLGAALATTFSRSAWLGALIGLVVLIFRLLPKQWRVWFGVVTVASGVAAYEWVKSTLLGASQPLRAILLRGELVGTTVIGSDEGHIQAVQAGVTKALQHPLGLGLGSAGPASTFGSAPSITENWYLQILLELGWGGLVAVLIAWLELVRVWWQSARLHDAVLLASLCGIAVACFFLHVWADSTLALIWWGLAGVSYAQLTRKKSA